MRHLDPHDARPSAPIPGAAITLRLADGWRDIGENEGWIEIAELSHEEIGSVHALAEETKDAISPGWRLAAAPECTDTTWRGSLILRAGGPGSEISAYLTLGFEISPDALPLQVGLDIEAIFVDADHRDMGYARALMDAAAEGAEVEIQAALGNEPGAIELIVSSRVRHPATAHLVEDFCRRMERFMRRHSRNRSNLFRDIS